MIGDNTQIAFEPLTTNHNGNHQVMSGGSGGGLSVGGGLGANRSKSVGAVQKSTLGSSKVCGLILQYSELHCFSLIHSHMII